jgi:predicted phage tail protein
MTTIILHGILAKEFGETFRMKISRAKEALDAINCNRENFIKRIQDLSMEGLNYAFIVDGKKLTDLDELNINKEPTEVHLVPLIVGSGGAALIGAIFAVAGGTIGGVTSTVFLAGLAGQITAGIASLAISMTLQMLLAPKPEAPPQISSTTKAMQESFSFSNKANLATQGSPVPVGYGRLKVGAQVVQFTIKSFPQSRNSTEAMTTNAYAPWPDVGNSAETYNNTNPRAT